ncbi:deoxyribodipyrimidine photo-lyase [Xinfangfangia sp. D13-10-4-6]|uniref:cryptochrome/photolyase family protein n=1 Tax=Pseudogemmobacter hezensis TaxID=2737662 RepID=UPI001554715F|nr:deoxyribodipyrimidine photo-lyase [Pseudogemmobacter hezensis]NPD14829.1 deoxyribodipyrimidine photo-lyase [Pseudogemmobacter hezensis]
MSAGLLWLSRNFRFSDNPALLAALADGPLLAVFCLDARTKALGAAPRWRLQRALQAFDAGLKKRGAGGVLIVAAEPEEALPALMQAVGAARVHQADWPEPQTRGQQARLRARIGAGLVLHPGHLLAHPAALRTGQGGVYKVFTPFANALRRLGAERPAPDAPARITGYAPPPLPFPTIPIAALALAPDMRRGGPVLARHALPAGEDAAFARLEDFLDRVGDYASTRDRPDIDATSGLSEHLALGEISPRSIWARAQIQAEADPGRESAIGKFLSEVIWREFAWHLLISFPDMPHAPWRGEWADFPWRGPGPDLDAWVQARTGVALVDAGLREMWVTGRMHNRVRMVVASWLTKNLLTHWHHGLAHFEACLTDWDPAANAMNWQWVAGCGPDASPYFRVFNPEKQAADYDPKGLYRRRWLAGYQGATGEEATAFLNAAPLSWSPAPRWSAGDPDRISGGRTRAHAALERFRQASTVASTVASTGDE